MEDSHWQYSLEKKPEKSYTVVEIQVILVCSVSYLEQLFWLWTCILLNIFLLILEWKAF